MQHLGLEGKCKQRKYRSYQGEVGKIADNLLRRDFSATKPNEKWVTDASELKYDEGKLYLSPIKDLFNGEIIAYDLSPSPNFEQITRDGTGDVKVGRHNTDSSFRPRVARSNARLSAFIEGKGH